MDNQTPLLELKGITKTFGSFTANEDINLTVYPGEVHALLGENGAGKSTLMNVIYGIYKPDRGEVFLSGKPVRIHSPKDALRHGIGMVHQHFMLVDVFSAIENMGLIGDVKTFSITNRRKIEDTLEQLKQKYGIDVDLHSPVGQLSIGMQQKVEILKLLYTGADVLIFDEPTAVLLPQECDGLFEIIANLTSEGKGVIFISHKLDEIFEICDRLTVFKDGEYVGDYDIGELNQLKLISLMVGKDTVELERNKQGYEFANAKVIAEMKDIRQGMRLNGINIEIKQGEVVGLAGLLGSGRTELAQVLFGSGMPDNGEIFWWGEKAGIHSPADAIKKGMGFCTEDRKTEGIIPHLSVRENITIALLPKLNSFGFVKTKEQDEIVRSYIDRLKIKTPTPEQAICNLSGGNQQKVLLARWMCMNPKLMILDEPTRGIDVGAKAEIEQLIQEFSKSGISVLMISSEIAELERNCDRIIVMREGRVIGELAGDQISQDKVMETIARGSESEGKTHE